MQWAWIWASSQRGPSGSAVDTISVREGWRPVSCWIVAAHRSPISGWRAMTTRFITLVRAAMCRPGSSPIRVSRFGSDQIRDSSASMSPIVRARDRHRSTGSPALAPPSMTIRPLPPARVPTARISPMAGDPDPDPFPRPLPCPLDPPIRSAASGGRRAR
jgi:hypothetical protein